MNPWAFAGSIAAGRGVRYFGAGLLAIWYGEQTIVFLERHGLKVAIAIAIAGAAAGVWWARRRRAPTPA
jgi:hypothetical protein